MMKLQFFGAAKTATGSKTLLTTHEMKILIDCGLFQGGKDLRLRNWDPLPFDASQVDALVLTHAHLDHSGSIPLLIRQGFKGPIYCTAATRDLCEIILRDSGRIQEEEAERANRYGYSVHKPALPLYTEIEALQALDRFKILEFGTDYQLGHDLKLHLSRAGHILGSAILTFRTNGDTLVFSGDLGRLESPIMNRPATVQGADYLVLESTYGDRLHPKDDPEVELGNIIRETVKRGGTVLIPSFAVGRAQVLLYLIHQLKRKGQIPDIPVYLDSPMAQDASDIMCRYNAEHRLNVDVCTAMCHEAEYVQTREDSKKLDSGKFPSVIISASGMLEGGRVLHHIRHLAPDPANSIVLVGYQAPMTRGERLLSGDKEIKIHGEMVPIRAKIKMIETLSSHADYGEMLQWLKAFNKAPRMVFLVHGENKSCENLKKLIEDNFGWRVFIPDYLEEFRL